MKLKIKKGMVFESSKDPRKIIEIKWVHPENRDETISVYYHGNYPYAGSYSVFSVEEFNKEGWILYED